MLGRQWARGGRWILGRERGRDVGRVKKKKVKEEDFFWSNFCEQFSLISDKFRFLISNIIRMCFTATARRSIVFCCCSPPSKKLLLLLLPDCMPPRSLSLSTHKRLLLQGFAGQVGATRMQSEQASSPFLFSPSHFSSLSLFPLRYRGTPQPALFTRICFAAKREPPNIADSRLSDHKFFFSQPYFFVVASSSSSSSASASETLG